jgi:TonB-linked SusC/RagA family outer membrane protein
MKNLLARGVFVWIWLSLAAPSSKAQTLNTLQGIVKSREGTALPGVSVIVKGNTTGAITNPEGKFRIIAAPGDILVFTYIGFSKQEVPVGKQSTLDITLQSDPKSINEVVVTALGIKKEKKAVGYAVQEVKGNDLVKAREPNAINALAGKVAGLTINTNTNLFGDPGFLLRGRKPLIVIDGVPVKSDSWNLSPDDIESYSVLKGANAAALYGASGETGAILITTKRGAKNTRGWSVDFNSSTQLQTGFNALPKVQHEYGPGDAFQYAFKDGKGGGVNDGDYFIWGPRFEGQLITQWNSPKDPATGELQPLPWTSKGAHNLENFLRNGLLSNNNIAISTSSEKGDFRMSLSQLYQRGQVPNTNLGGTNFNISGGVNVSSKLRFEANVNINKQYTKNYPSIAYSPRSLIYNILVWGGSDYDIRELKDYWLPGKEGIQQKWVEYTQYSNPWFVANEQLHGYYKTDIYGYLKMNYRFSDKLNFYMKTNLSTYNKDEDQRYPVSGTFYGDYYKVGGYEEYKQYFWDNTTEGLFSYNNQFGKWGLNASAGANLRTIQFREINASTKGGLLVPDVYTLANSAERATPTNRQGTKQVLSGLGLIDLDYDGKLFLGLTGRVDRSSTLPKQNNVFFYPSVSAGIIVSELMKLPRIVDYLKLRGSYANVNGDIGSIDNLSFYSINMNYEQGSRWDNNASVSYTGTLIDRDLKPSRTETFETGLEARLFKNRIGLDVAYFRNIEGPGIVDIALSAASGYGKLTANANKYIRKGMEVTLTATPVKRQQGFSWDVLVNWYFNHRWLKEVDGIQDRLGNVRLGQRVDEYWLKDFQRSADGKVIVNGNNGLPAKNPYVSNIGHFDNNFIASINNTFSYKRLSLSFQFDGRFGGIVYNYMDQTLWSSGRHPESANDYRYADWQHRNDPAYKGSVMTNGLKIVSGELKSDEDGNITSDTRKFAPNDVPVLWQTWARNYYGSGNITLIHKRTYVKLREVIFTYRLPNRFMGRDGFFSAASVSLIGRNLLYFTGKGTRNVDLDMFNDSGTDFQTPAVKSFGVNLNLSF